MAQPGSGQGGLLLEYFTVAAVLMRGRRDNLGIMLPDGGTGLITQLLPFGKIPVPGFPLGQDVTVIQCYVIPDLRWGFIAPRYQHTQPWLQTPPFGFRYISRDLKIH